MKAVKEFSWKMNVFTERIMDCHAILNSPDVNETLAKLVLTDAVPPPVPFQLKSKSQHVFMEMARIVDEVVQSQQTLTRIQVLARRLPDFPMYAEAGIDEPWHLKYHCENFLNELYLLHQRLQSLIDLALRLHRKNRPVVGVLHGLKRQIRELMGAADAARGEHTHHQRFSVPEFRKLELLRIMSSAQGPHDTELKKRHRAVMADCKKAMLHGICRTNGKIDSFLDEVFLVLDRVLIDEHGDFVGVTKAEQAPGTLQ
jgi:hypothetical protein